MQIELYLLGEKIPNKIILPKLDHGSKIITVETGEEDLQDRDGLITKNRELILGIRTADCAPICFGDGEKIAIIHVGWRGLCAEIIEKMLSHFDVSSLEVYVGPFLHIFEIKKDFCYEQISGKFGDKYFKEVTGQIFFDFKKALASLLPAGAVFDSRSTGVDLSFPSYRRDKTKDRFVTALSFLKK